MHTTCPECGQALNCLDFTEPQNCYGSVTISRNANGEEAELNDWDYGDSDCIGEVSYYCHECGEGIEIDSLVWVADADEEEYEEEDEDSVLEKPGQKRPEITNTLFREALSVIEVRTGKQMNPNVGFCDICKKFEILTKELSTRKGKKAFLCEACTNNL